jgi:hypothetical protein
MLHPVLSKEDAVIGLKKFLSVRLNDSRDRLRALSEAALFSPTTKETAIIEYGRVKELEAQIDTINDLLKL